MTITLACEPGSSQRANEDWCAALDLGERQLAIVLDGVTSHGDTGCSHGTPWYVRQLGGHLLALAADESNHLNDALEAAIGHVALQHETSCDVRHPGTPAAAVAVVRIAETHLEYLVLADTTIIIDDHAQGPRTVSDHRVNDVVAPHIAATTHHAIGSPEHSAAVGAMSVEQRRWRNRKGGYWVAAADPSAATQSITGSVDKQRVRQAALFSDGASRLVDTFGSHTWPEALRMLASSGPDGLIDHVRELERQDSTGARWPRFKHSDDAACVYIKPRAKEERSVGN